MQLKTTLGEALEEAGGSRRLAAPGGPGDQQAAGLCVEAK
jgi:hypothetical protein